MKKKEKITWIIIGIVFGVADLMALHNIYASGDMLFTESAIIIFSLFVLIVLISRILKNR